QYRRAGTANHVNPVSFLYATSRLAMPRGRGASFALVDVEDRGVFRRRAVDLHHARAARNRQTLTLGLLDLALERPLSGQPAADGEVALVAGVLVDGVAGLSGPHRPHRARCRVRHGIVDRNPVLDHVRIDTTDALRRPHAPPIRGAARDAHLAQEAARPADRRVALAVAARVAGVLRR